MILLCSFLYWRPISLAPILTFDDTNVIQPLENVTSFQDYSKLWDDNVILDVQPIRDLTYIVEYRIANFINWPIHTVLVNLIIWFCSLYFIFSIFRLQNFTNLQSKLMISYLSLHPALVNSIAWGSSRKHLLSALFISGATLFWLKWFETKNTRYAVLAPIFFLLSCFSQPINSAWFLWAGLIFWFSDRNATDFRKLKISKIVMLLLIFIGAATILINLWYYSSPRYLLNSYFPKFTHEGLGFIGNRILIFGRYIFQLILPINPSVYSYFPGSWMTMAGIFIGTFLGLVIWKLRPNFKIFLFWGSFTILPLLVVSGPANHHYGWDTYLLTPLIGWTLLLGVIWKITADRFNHEKLQLAFLAVILILFSIRTKTAADAWGDDESLWKQAVNSDPSPKTQSMYLNIILNNYGHKESTFSEIVDFSKNYPTNEKIPYLLSKAVYANPTLPEKFKIDFFGNLTQFDQIPSKAWFLYYSAAYEASQNRFETANERMELIFRDHKDNRSKSLFFLSSNLEEVAARWYAICVYAKKKGCVENIKSIKASLPSSKWSNDKLSTNLKKFDLTVSI